MKIFKAMLHVILAYVDFAGKHHKFFIGTRWVIRKMQARASKGERGEKGTKVMGDAEGTPATVDTLQPEGSESTSFVWSFVKLR